MSVPTPTTYPPLTSPRILIPITTTILGTLGLGTGLNSLLRPGPSPANMFGLTVPPPSSSSKPDEPTARQLAWIRIYGVRNLSGALGLLGLTAFWRFSATCRSSSVAAGAVQKALAVLMGTGFYVAAVDAWILRRYVVESGDGLGDEARKVAEEKVWGHVGVVLPVVGLAVGWWFL